MTTDAYVVPQWFGALLFLALCAAVFGCFVTWAAGRDVREEVAELRRRLDEVAPAAAPDPVLERLAVRAMPPPSPGGTDAFLDRLRGDYRRGSDER